MKPGNKQRPPLIMSLKQIFEGTSEFTGKEYFRSLVKKLSEILEVHGVWITEYKEEEQRLNALAFWLDGKFVEKYEYDIKGTPCEPVLERKELFHVPDKVVDLYPDDPDLPPLDAVSYMGIVLKDIDGKILGHLALLDTEPMEELPEVYIIFKLFASRAGAELRRLRYEKRLKESESKISRLLNGTMDAIIEMNGDLEITQANTAALSLFQVKKEAFIGNTISNYLEKDAFQKLIDVLPFLGQKKGQIASRWIPGYLDCQNAEGNTFPAEATMAYYHFEERDFYALYIRDVRDRINKEAEIKKLKVETSMLKEQVSVHQIGNIIGESLPLKNLFTQIYQVSPTNSTVLILGETGTGKELIAQEIHKQSLRKNEPFIALNCATLPAELIDSELFGHIKGAFTGATQNREGRFALADKGTLFLDEIGELPLSLQAKLLRVIQEGEFEPVGSSFTQKVDVRIIAATHRDLKQEVVEKRFREDLFYRLNVFPIFVPPLRDRGNDILLLAEAFLRNYSERHGRKGIVLNQLDKETLLHYSWPGNVRELQNIIERGVITSQSGNFQLSIQAANKEEKTHVRPEKILTNEELQEMEIENLKLALTKTKGKVFGENGAAKLVGIPSTTFKSKLLKYGINPKEFI